MEAGRKRAPVRAGQMLMKELMLGTHRGVIWPALISGLLSPYAYG